jgi:hypothetical protein
MNESAKTAMNIKIIWDSYVKMGLKAHIGLNFFEHSKCSIFNLKFHLSLETASVV